MQDRVHLGRLHDPIQDGVGLVGANELGPLERDGRGVRAHAQDHVHARVGLEGLDHPAPPKGVRTGDEDASAHRSQPNQTLRRSRQHVEDRLLEQRADLLGLLHDPALGVPVLVGRYVEADGIEHPQLDLGWERCHHAERSEDEEVGGDREVGNAEGLGQCGHAHDHGHGLLRAHDGDGDDGDAGSHRDLDEAAAAEPAQLVPVGEGLGRAFRPLGEDESKLPLLLQQAIGVGGSGRHPAGTGPQGPDDRHRPEEVVRQAVDGAVELLLNPVHDDGGVGGNCPAWFATRSAPPSVGIFSRPSHSARNHLE